MIATTTNYFDFAVAEVNLDCSLVHLDYNWDGLHKLKAAYGPKVDIYDPGLLGIVMISSGTAEKSAKDLAAEFKIELLDDYYVRALADRDAPGSIEP